MKSISIKSLTPIALITSMVISLFLVIPIFSLNIKLSLPMQIVWINILVRFLLLWAINFVILKKFANRFTLSIFRVFISTGILMSLDMLIHHIWGTYYPFKGISELQLFMIRLPNILLFDILIYVIIKQILSKEKELKILRANNELKFKYLESEYLLLKSQINPHFLFNAFNTAKSLISKNPKEAESYIIKLSEFMRASIEYEKRTSTLKEELEICNNFIDLQKVRFDGTFSYVCEIDIKYLHYNLPFFSLISLLENTFKHNVFNIDNPLIIRIYNRDEIIFVSNNINHKRVLNSTQSGLKNLNNRLKIITGKELEIINNGMEFTVKFEMIKHENSNN